MYTTLARAKAELSATSTTDDAKLMNYIGIVTQRLRGFGYEFEPWYDSTRYFSVTGMNTSVGRGTLALVNGSGQQMLLASSTDVPTVSINGTSYAYGTKVLPYPQGVTPIKTLRLSDVDYTICDTWYPNSRQFLDTVIVGGWWGYRENYAAEGWLTSGQTVLNAAGITAGGTSITVTDVDGTDALFRTPVFSAGNLIRIENEMLLVYATDTTLNTLTVRRSVNGSTAAAHAKDTAIKVWEWEPDIVQAASRQVGLLYARRGSFTQTNITGGAMPTYPQDLLAELYATLQRFQYT